MKKTLLIIGIICIIVCVLSLLFAALNRFGYYHLLDGSSEHYTQMKRKMVIFLIIGFVLAVIGIVCIIIRFKK